jgi:hypothetical protein
MASTVLALWKEFEVTNMRQLHWLFGIQITLNHNSIDLLHEACVDKILKRFQMNDSHSTLLPIDPNIRVLMEDSILEAEEYPVYQSIIGSYMYLVIWIRPDLAYPVF